VVVTGGAGFIGSHIAEELVSRGYQTVVIDDLSNGNLENIKHLLNKSNFHFIKGSVVDLPLLKKVCLDVDYIFHHAALISVPLSIDNPSRCHEVNLTGTLNVLIASRDNGIKKVVFASSSSVYGNNPLLPKTEDMLPNPQSPYAVTKLAGEYYCDVFRAVFGLASISLRYFNVYGPRQNPNSQYSAVIPKFIRAVKEDKPPEIFGNGQQTRDFVFVKDVVQANILAVESNYTGIFNIGSGERLSLNRVLRVILTQMNKKDIKPVYARKRVGDIKHSLADIKKAQNFSYKPSYSFTRGLQETIESFK
jgi:UDP-glucose 4-epimerase